MATKISTYYQFSVRPCLNSKPRLFFRIGEYPYVWAENVFFNDYERAIQYLNDRLYIEREVKRNGGEETEYVMERIEACMENGMWTAGNSEAMIELSPTVAALI